MSNLSITEYHSFGRGPSGVAMGIGHSNPVALQDLTFTSTSVPSAAFNASTNLVRVSADASARILFGSAPTALASASILLPSGTVEFFEVEPGEKVAVITNV